MAGCPRCGEENDARARFCSSCGLELSAAPSDRQERKVVSVLFVDLVGFTSRSDQADPEDVRDLLQAYHAGVKERVERFGGVVEKFIGDAVMAVFGAPLAHSDDPERAVRAGFAALEAVEELRRRQPGHDLSARAAVNTGEAVVAVGSDHESGQALAMGDVVNTASRLQTSAPPGGLVVGEETYRGTRDSIRYEALPAVQAKGKHEPVAAWLAVEPVAGPAERRVRGTPMVGRDRELGLLQSVWERATTDRRPHLVTVLGPPGIGKSRLSREFAGMVDGTGGRTIRGRCLPYDTRDVYGAFGQQVKHIAGIFEQDSPEQARAKVAHAVGRLLPEAEREEVTKSLSLMLGLGLDAVGADQRLLLLSARRLIERLGEELPTLLVFEDVHWADSAQLDLIGFLAAHAKETPVILLALARPELIDLRPTWGAGLQTQTTISLDPLSDTEAADIVRHLVGEDLPNHAMGRLVEVAEGNPLFVEELTAALAEGADLGGELPTTVRAAIAARIDALPPEQRSALFAASVVGRVFWRGAVEALGQTDGLDGVLDALEIRDLIRRESSSRVRGDTEFTFKHALIRDVCYGTLPRAERKRAHKSVATYIEHMTGGQDRELAWLLAHHWEAAGDTSRAVDYLLLAADRAREALAQEDAMALFDRALGLAADDAAKTGIRLRKALAYVALEDFDAAVPELDALIPSLEGMDLLEALVGLARSCTWIEQTDRVIEASQQAIDLAERLEAPEMVPPAMAALSQGLAMRGREGDLAEAIDVGERAIRAWVRDTRLVDLAEHEYLMASQYYWAGDYQRALESARKTQEHAVDPNSGEALLRGGGIVGLSLTALGRYEEAFASFDAVIAVGREMGRPVRTLLNYSTAAYRELFDLEEARRRSEESLTIAGRSPNFHMPWMNALVDLVHVDVLAGEIGAAESRWRELYDEVLATPAWERWLLGSKMAAFRAEMAIEIEGPEAWAEWARKAIEMTREARRPKYEAQARATLGQALVAMGRGSEGLDELRSAAQTADALANPAGRWQAQAALARALYDIGDDDGAGRAFTRSADILRGIIAGLSPERAQRFAAAPPVAEVLKTAG